MNADTPDIEITTARLYAVYCRAVGGVAFNGDPLPDWEDFSKDPAKTKQANAWREVGKTAANLNF